MKFGWLTKCMTLGVGLLFVGILAACGGRENATPPQRGMTSSTASNGALVAVFGDTEQDLTSGIAAARAAGLRPAFVSVQTANQTHVFNVYAQVVRTSKALVVRAYGHVYVFRLSDVRSLGYAGAPISMASIPRVAWSGADRAALGQPGRFLYLQSEKTQLCSDCEAVLINAQHETALLSKWNGALDSWQLKPNYVPWAPSPAPGSRHVDGTNHCVQTSRYTTTCYAYGGSSGIPGGGGGGGGGDSVPLGNGGVPPTPATPQPSASPGCSTADRTAAKQMNADFNPALQKEKSSGGEWEGMGYIYQNNSTGAYSYIDEGLFQLDSSGSTSVPYPPSLSGYTLVGWYHTHPDTYDWDNGNGVGANGTNFSDSDIQNTLSLGVPGYVAEYNDAGVYSTDPNTMTAEESFQWYKTNGTAVPNTSNPTKYSQTSEGVLSASSGC